MDYQKKIERFWKLLDRDPSLSPEDKGEIVKALVGITPKNLNNQQLDGYIKEKISQERHKIFLDSLDDAMRKID